MNKELPINEQIKAESMMVIGPNGEQMGQKKLKEQQKKQRETNKEVKEYRLSTTIDVHDFDTRVRNAKDYLVKGHRIKAFIRFKGRQMARPELGKDVLLRFAEALEEVSSIEAQPKLEGRQMFMLLAPNKNK